MSWTQSELGGQYELAFAGSSLGSLQAHHQIGSLRRRGRRLHDNGTLVVEAHRPVQLGPVQQVRPGVHHAELGPVLEDGDRAVLVDRAGRPAQIDQQRDLVPDSGGLHACPLYALAAATVVGSARRVVELHPLLHGGSSWH